ncbi:MAG TPA: hypothetical protein VFH68_27300 [Polyangia bacterium]|jgi:hypothetical protein|nr:hypothetical protein [Polyangia bacterium]
MLAVLALAGCDGGGAGPAVLGSQLLAGRDFGNLFYWNHSTLGFTRPTSVPGATTEDLWVWPDGEAEPLVALTEVDWSPPTDWSEVIVGNTLMTGAQGERIYDLDRRAAIDLTRVPPPLTLYLPNLTFAAVRRDGKALVAFRAEDATLAVGQGANVIPIAPFQAHGAGFMGADVVVQGAPVRASNGVLDNVYRVSVATGEISKMEVPPFDDLTSEANRLDVEFYCGAFSTYPCGRFRVVGCGEGDPPCAETGQPPCALLYMRTDTAMAPRRRPYAFDPATGQELALPGFDPDVFVVSPDQHRVAWMTAQDGEVGGVAGTGDSDIHVHDFCTGAESTCTLGRPSMLAWRGDGRLVTATIDDYYLGLFNVDAGSCERFGKDTTLWDVASHQYSPAGDRMVGVSWNRAVDPIAQMLWVSDADGHQPRMLAEGPFQFYGDLPLSPDGRRVFIIRIAGEQLSYGWVSTVDQPAVEQVIASAHWQASRGGDHRALLIDRWNGQDASGSLGLFDLDRGTRQELARAVTDFAIDGSVDGEARVVYSVRGRFASGQDGLWQTTLPPP